MRTREEVLAYCLTYKVVYQDAPFHKEEVAAKNRFKKKTNLDTFIFI